MSRGRSRNEPDFGSDSFLDIIANLVGILIILIVLAGLRASETVDLSGEGQEARGKEQVAVNSEPASVTSAGSSPEEVAARLQAEDEARRKAAAEKAAGEQAAAELEAERQRRLAAIDEAARLAALSRLREQRLNELQAAASQLDESAAESTLAVTRKKRDELDNAERLLIATRNRLEEERIQAEVQAGEQSRQLRELATELDQVNRELARLIDTKPETETLSHRVSPVGRVVLGDEIHFRISQGKISHVPIEELTEILRDNIRQNGSWLLKYNRHAGKVGPVEGYRLDYVVVRESLGTGDYLRSGQGMVKISLSEFVIRPTVDLEEQAAGESLRPGGLVYRRLATVPPGSPVTLWVYPDSFSEYREVAAFAQRNGFIVAGRPLPPGMPISGSPQGSRSVAQ